MNHYMPHSASRQMVGVVLTVGLLLSSSWAAETPRGYQTASARSQEIAEIGATQGEAKIQRAGEAQFKPVQTNAPLYLLDFLATGRAAKIWWKDPGKDAPGSATWSPLPSMTHGSLGENSVFGFLSFRRISMSSKFVGQVRKGIVRFIKKIPRTDPPSSFSIATPTAWIEVVPTDRAADFVVGTTDQSLSTVTVIWGEVRVKNISDKLHQERVLRSCQQVDVEKDKEPGEIRWVSSDTMKNLIQRTTIPNTLPTDVPACERIEAEVVRGPGAVFIAPSDDIIVPVPFPVAVYTPPPGDKCPCPPDEYWDPRTNKCACPCPPNYQLVPGQGCVPCRPSSVNNVNVLSTNGPRLTNGSKKGSNGNGSLVPKGPSSCNCSCPCPEGQILLPGGGCVGRCPGGFSVSYDASENAPYRCPFCRQGLVPLPPGCQNDQQCGRCERCVAGNCQPLVIDCARGTFLNTESCSCEPVDGFVPKGCNNDEGCPACERCINNQCTRAITCVTEDRLNLETCQCERVSDGVHQIPPAPEVPEVLESGPPAGCRANSDCAQDEICRKGKCVKKPPPEKKPPTTSQPLGGTGSFSQPFVEDPSIQELRRDLQGGDSIGPQFGIGIGGGGFSGGSGGGRQIVPRTPQKIAPIQRVPRKGGGPN